MVDICMWCLGGQAAAAAEVRRLELSLQEEQERLRRQAEAETLPGGEAAWRTDAVVEAAAVRPPEPTADGFVCGSAGCLFARRPARGLPLCVG